MELNLSAEETMQWEDIIQRMSSPQLRSSVSLNSRTVSWTKNFNSGSDSPRSFLNQNWSWDRILRSCFIKQADVLQGLFFLGDRYDLETKRATSIFMNQ